jgi:hypothetical protein
MGSAFLRLTGVVLGLAVLATGCATARAETVPDGPPLTVPEPPTRVFAPLTERPLAAEPAVAETPTDEAPSVATQPTDQRPAPRRAQTPPPAPEPAAPAPEQPRELRAASTPADADADRAIRATLDVARRDLRAINRASLSRSGLEQFNQAVDFAAQADEALKERNYPYAKTLADKSAEVAAALRNR